MARVITREEWNALECEVEAEGGVLRDGFPGWLRPLLARGTRAITLGRHIYLDGDLLAAAGTELAAIVAHELVHVRQFARVGPARFIWRYLCEYARNRRLGLSSFAAYEAISFEVEARLAENRFRRAEESGENVREG